MKKKAIPPFTLTAGQSGRLLFNFTLPEGADTPALRGALMVQGQRVDMENTQADMLTIPALPAGVYLTEVRAAGVCVLYGHVEVLPSPLFEDSGMAAYRVDVDNTTDVLQVSLSMVEGIPGMQGAQGEQGEKGDTGASAYQLAAQYGYTGTEAEWIAELQGAQAAATAAKDSAATATTAAATATEARTAATTAADTATKARTAATTAAEQAAATLAASAKKDENNTFNGTNTFNGLIAANGGITGLPAATSDTDAASVQTVNTQSYFNRTRELDWPISWSLMSGSKDSTIEDAYTRWKLLRVPANKVGHMTAAAPFTTSGCFYPFGSYTYWRALYLPLSLRNVRVIGTGWRVALGLCVSRDGAADTIYGNVPPDDIEAWAYNWRTAASPSSYPTTGHLNWLQISGVSDGSNISLTLRALAYTSSASPELANLRITENVRIVAASSITQGNDAGLTGLYLIADATSKGVFRVLLELNLGGEYLDMGTVRRTSWFKGSNNGCYTQVSMSSGGDVAFAYACTAARVLINGPSSFILNSEAIKNIDSSGLTQNEYTYEEYSALYPESTESTETT